MARLGKLETIHDGEGLGKLETWKARDESIKYPNCEIQAT
jgi:hypothetical protein